MYLKSGSIIVTNDISELPLTEIKQGQHLVLLEEKNVGYLSDKTVDSSTSMLCSEIHNGILYVMECNSTHVVNNYENHMDDEDEDEDEKDGIDEIDEDPPTLEVKHFQRTYLNVDGSLYNLGDRDRWEYGYSIEELGHDNNMIHNQLFSTNYKWFRQFSNSDSFIAVMPIDLGNDTCLVFKVKSSFFNSYLKWDVSCSAFIIKKDSSKEINLSANFLNLYSSVKEMKKDFLNKEDFEKFDNILNLINYNIGKHVNSSKLEQDAMINKLLGLAQHGVSKQDLEKLFSFFYRNEDLNIEICIDSVKKYNPGYIIYKEGALISNYRLDEETKIEVAKADALYRWDNMTIKNGVDPRSGELYMNNNKIQYPLGTYSDVGGIIHKGNSYNPNYYISYDGIFIRKEERDQEVKDLLERKRVVETLTSGL